MDSNVSLADIAAVTKDGDGWGGGNSGWWIIILFFAIMMNGGWGNNGFANAIGYENLATSNEVQRGFDNQNLQAQTRDILAAVNDGTAQAVAATNQTFHDTLQAQQSLYNEVQRDLSGLALGQANILAKQNECCCDTLRAIDQANFQGAQNTSQIVQAVREEGNVTRALMQQDKIEALQQQVAQLQLEQQMAGVVRYPSGLNYNAGPSPFCGCGCGGNI